VKKCVNMVKHMKIPVLGIIENMSYLKCPHVERKYSCSVKKVENILQRNLTSVSWVKFHLTHG